MKEIKLPGGGVGKGVANTVTPSLHICIYIYFLKIAFKVMTLGSTNQIHKTIRL